MMVEVVVMVMIEVGVVLGGVELLLTVVIY